MLSKNNAVFIFFLNHDDACYCITPQAFYIQKLIADYVQEFVTVTEDEDLTKPAQEDQKAGTENEGIDSL